MVLLIPDLMKSQLRTLQLFEFKLHFGDTKVAAPLETLGKAIAELQKKKPTYIGMDLQFEWDEVEAFVRQLDGSLFNWCERFCCFTHLLYGIVFVFLEAEYATPQNSLNQGYELLHQMEPYINQPGLISQESRRSYGGVTWGVGDVSPPVRLTMMWMLMWLCGTKFIFIEICRALLAYVHGVIGVCHLDIKPQNLLVNPHTHQLKICDFGSAEKMVLANPIYHTYAQDIIGLGTNIWSYRIHTTIDMWSGWMCLSELSPWTGWAENIGIFLILGKNIVSTLGEMMFWWENAHHRRSVAASLVQGVYVLERDRLENRQGPHALAS
ncbi:hypothetical protein IFM89_009543 [Coptis chinensis]|uniref:Protein kinase domain-containing protein n=1 Tax=Coptis chinensis TaxID=261450 RepID=A0A835I716_9MAGN|nr:hypothetical protein IFM89_009543 [Coptis chinensis]